MHTKKTAVTMNAHPIKAHLAHPKPAQTRLILVLAAALAVFVLAYIQLAPRTSKAASHLIIPHNHDSMLGLYGQVNQQLQHMQSETAAGKVQLGQVQDSVASLKRLVQAAVTKCLRQPVGAEAAAAAVTVPLTFTGMVSSTPAAAAPAAPAGPPTLVNTSYTESALVDFKGFKLQLVALKNDEVVGAYILKEKRPYEPDYLSVLMDYVTPGSVVVDAGANMGSYSAFFAAKAGHKGAVYAFEPQQRMYQVLVTNMMVNGLTWLHPINAALSYEPGVLNLQGNVTHGTTWGSSYKDADKHHKGLNYGGQRLGVGGEEVKAITLDSLNLTGVSLIKVDVQWAERMVLYGARDTIKRNLPVVSYELPDDTMVDQLTMELNLPPEVMIFDYEVFLKQLGYHALADPTLPERALLNDRVMLPPRQENRLGSGRRLLLH